MSARGLIRAVVVDVDDEEKRGRVRLSIPELFYDSETEQTITSPWCEPKGGGGRGVGTLDVPEVGSVVWVQSVYSSEDQDYQLVYERGTHGADASGSYIPPTAGGVDDESVWLKVSAPFSLPSAGTSLKLTSPTGATRREADSTRDTIDGAPTSANAGVYPRNKTTKTAGGFVIEQDDTPGQERLGIHHPSGASFEVNAQGVLTQRASKRWSEVMETVTERVGGDERRRVDGSIQVGVGGNYVEETANRRVILAGELDILTRYHMLQQVGGQFHQKVTGPMRVEAMADMAMTAGGRVKLSSAGNMALLSGLGNMSIAAAMQVRIASLMGTVVSGPAGLDVTPLGTLGHPVALAIELGAVLEAILIQLVNVSKAPAVAADATVSAGTAAIVTMATGIPAVVATFSAPHLRSSTVAGV